MAHFEKDSVRVRWSSYGGSREDKRTSIRADECGLFLDGELLCPAELLAGGGLLDGTKTQVRLLSPGGRPIDLSLDTEEDAEALLEALGMNLERRHMSFFMASQRTQRAGFGVWWNVIMNGVMVGGVGGLVVLLQFGLGWQPPGWLVFGVGVIVAIVLMVAMSAATTATLVLSKEGVELRDGRSQESIPWSELQSIVEAPKGLELRSTSGQSLSLVTCPYPGKMTDELRPLLLPLLRKRSLDGVNAAPSPAVV